MSTLEDDIFRTVGNKRGKLHKRPGINNTGGAFIEPSASQAFHCVSPDMDVRSYYGPTGRHCLASRGYSAKPTTSLNALHSKGYVNFDRL